MQILPLTRSRSGCQIPSTRNTLNWLHRWCNTDNHLKARKHNFFFKKNREGHCAVLIYVFIDQKFVEYDKLQVNRLSFHITTDSLWLKDNITDEIIHQHVLVIH